MKTCVSILSRNRLGQVDGLTNERLNKETSYTLIIYPADFLLKIFPPQLYETFRTKEQLIVFTWQEIFANVCFFLFSEKAVDISFEDLLGFATGANKIPPRGFQKPLEIHFFSEINRLPCVSTCAMELYLPRGIKEPKVFNDKMYMAIKGSLGFDKI